MCLSLGVVEAASKTTYLGLPAVWGRYKKVDLHFIEERIMKQIQSWKGKMLTQGGREILLKSVITAIATYLMQCSYLPRGFTKKVESHMVAFWWGDYGHKKTLHWIKRELLCLPKNMDSMGFRNLKCLTWHCLLNKLGD